MTSIMIESTILWLSHYHYYRLSVVKVYFRTNIFIFNFMMIVNKVCSFFFFFVRCIVRYIYIQT
uniref:Uncharacterized protein n=1 Tax=Octopus bimaculoides TaxID=37653 RepID=A0A0L8G4Q1_OCTBM